MKNFFLPKKMATWRQNKSRRSYVRNSLRLVHGPAMTRLAKDEVALVILGRNMAFFLDHHIRHHLAFGISHIVYIDNGSTDNSIEIVKQFPNVTIAHCSASFRDFQGLIRYFANTLYLRGGWRLAIDPDELLEYPGSDHIDLPELTRRMSARGHTALVAQMLEMIPEGPLGALSDMPFREIEAVFDRYSLKAINPKPYHSSDIDWTWFLDQNRIATQDTHILFGGLRNAAFGENCCLTKHALFRMDKGVVPHPHPHVTTGVTCTDFTALLKHYKFAGGVVEREKKLLAENRISHGETKRRVARFETDGDLDLGQYAEHCDPNWERLSEQGFVHASKDAKAMLEISG